MAHIPDGYDLLTAYDKGKPVAIKLTQKLLVEHWLSRSGEYKLKLLGHRLENLCSDFHTGDKLDASGTIRSLKIDQHMSVRYRILSKLVLIEQIDFDASADAVEVGLYQVGRGEDKQWQTKMPKVSEIDKNHTWPARDQDRSESDRAHYAAFVGRYGSVSSAGKLLGEHVVGAHTLARNQQISEIEAEDSSNFFTMLYMDGMSHSSRQAQTLMAETIDRNVSAGIRINTVIQGEAAGTFLALARAGLVKADSNQQFFFSNPIGGSAAEFEDACRSIGAVYTGSNFNTFNIKQRYYNTMELLRQSRIAHGNLRTALSLADKSLIKAGSAVEKVAFPGLTAVGAGTTGKFLLDNAGVSSILKNQDLFLRMMENAATQPYVQGALVAAGMALVYKISRNKADLIKSNYQSIKATTKSNLGAANQYWFKDATRFKQRV